MTLHAAWIVVRHSPVMREFLACRNVTHCNEDNLAVHAYIRIAGVIAEDHASFPLFLGQRPNEEVIVNLNLSRAEQRTQFVEPGAVEDVPAFDADNFSFGDVLCGE